MLAVGSDDRNTNAGGKVQIHEYNEASRSVHCKDIDNCRGAWRKALSDV